jgi:hypothetical protein
MSSLIRSRGNSAAEFCVIQHSKGADCASLICDVSSDFFCGRKALLKILDDRFRSLPHLLHANGVMILLQVPTISSVLVVSHRVPISKLPVPK